MSTNTKTIVFVVIAVCVAVAVALVVGDRRYETRATYSEFLQHVQSGEVDKATIAVAANGADALMYSLKNGARIQTIVPRDYKDALAVMRAKQVNVEIRNAPQWWSVLANGSPFLILMAFWVFMMRQLKNKPNLLSRG